VHTGDITRPRTLELLARLEVPLVGVYGNNDAGERAGLEAAGRRLGLRFEDPPLELAWAERRVVVVHDPRALDALPPGSHDVALHGHTHRLALERHGGRLLFNPGECAGHMPGRNAVGVLDLARLEAELLLF
jgi:hypothetical protein